MEQATRQVDTSPSWDDQLLDWFADQGIPIVERKFRLGNIEFFQFASYLDAAGLSMASFGSDQNRKLAAVKCVAEHIERRAMVEHFRDSTIPLSLRNSNGWAVHGTQIKAKERAVLEATERHLLLKSFFLYGWKGLLLRDTININEITLYLLTSCFSSADWISGLVIAQSPLYRGISIGYCIGESQKVIGDEFWMPAIFEAMGKIFSLNGKQMEASSSWIDQDAKYFLECKFDLSQISNENQKVIDCSRDLKDVETLICDLSEQKSLKFPLFAAYAKGRAILPLFKKSSLCPKAMSYVMPILRKNGLSFEQIPERYPVL